MKHLRKPVFAKLFKELEELRLMQYRIISIDSSFSNLSFLLFGELKELIELELIQNRINSN